MSQKPSEVPTVIIDTGTLLTLLLGGETNQPGYAYTKLLVDSAKRKIVNLVIPDMVLGEFMGVSAPLYAKDFVGDKPLFSSEKVRMGFSHGEERVRLVKELLQENNVTITETNCGDEYLGRIQKLLPYNEKLQAKGNAAGEATPIESLRQRLLFTGSKLAKEVKQNTLRDRNGNAVSSGRQDRGEIAVADSIKQIQKEKGKDHQVFVLFEGSDVRGRIIQRLCESKGESNDYNQWSGDVLPEYNPNSDQFKKNNCAKLGNINFVSTKGFIAGFMRAAEETEIKILNHKSWFIINKDEAKTKKSMDDAYHELVENVNANGVGRIYQKYRDRNINNLLTDDTDEHYMVNRVPQDSPWMKYMISVTEKDSPTLGTVRDLIKDFIDYRQTSLQADSEARFAEIRKNIHKMQPEPAQKLLNWMVVQLGEIFGSMTKSNSFSLSA